MPANKYWKKQNTQKSQHSDSNWRHKDPQNHGDRFMMCLLVVALGNRHQSTHQVSRFFSRSEGLVVLACGNSAVKTDGRLQLKCNEVIFYMESPLPETHFLGSSP